MERWQIALNKFLDQYRNEDYFLGAILTGSYATGNSNANSDIDVYIVTKDSTNWRERGNKIIDGYMIEYFINPVKKILSYFEKEQQDYHMSTTMIFVNGKILIDTDNEVQKLIDKAKEIIKSPLKEVDDFKWKMNCYSVWDGFDELESKYYENADIDFTYYIFLQRIVESYFYNKQISSIPLNKLEKILSNVEYRTKYNVQQLPDDRFVELLLNCFNAKDRDKKFVYAKEIYNYFLSQFPTFDIGNLEIRSSAE